MSLQVVLALWQAKDLNVYLLGEEAAHSLGIDVQTCSDGCLFWLAHGRCMCLRFGVIGFVGLMVPHALRLILGPSIDG